MGAWVPSASSFLRVASPDGELAQTLHPKSPRSSKDGRFQCQSPRSHWPTPLTPAPADTDETETKLLTWHCIWGLFVPWLEEAPGAAQTTRAKDAPRMQRHERLGTLSKPTEQTPAVNKLGCHTFLTPKKCTGKGPVSHQIVPQPPHPPPLSILSNTNTSSDTPAWEIAEPIPLPNGPLLLRPFLSPNLHNPFFLKFQVITPRNASLSPCKQPSPFAINHYKLIFRKEVSLKLLQPFY